MRPKSETSDFKLLVFSKSISYFRKYGTHENVGAIDSKIVLLKKDLIVRNTTSFIAYWKTVYENARGIRYMVACLLNFFK